MSNTSTYNHALLLGLNAVKGHGGYDDADPIGVITDSYFEGSRHILVIDDSHEIIVSHAELVISLVDSSEYIRVKTL